MDVKKTAAQILKEVGGKENIKEMFHCVTRLRFYVKDYKKVDLEHIKKIDGVMGAQYQTEQLQIIIGNDVGSVYDAVTALPGSSMMKRQWRKRKNSEPQAYLKPWRLFSCRRYQYWQEPG